MQHEKPLEETIQVVGNFLNSSASDVYKDHVDVFYTRWYQLYYPKVTAEDFEDTFFDYASTDKEISIWAKFSPGHKEWKTLVVISFFYHSIYKKYYESNKSINESNDGIQYQNHPNGFDLLF